MREPSTFQADAALKKEEKTDILEKKVGQGSRFSTKNGSIVFAFVPAFSHMPRKRTPEKKDSFMYARLFVFSLFQCERYSRVVTTITAINSPQCSKSIMCEE